MVAIRSLLVSVALADPAHRTAETHRTHRPGVSRDERLFSPAGGEGQARPHSWPMRGQAMGATHPLGRGVHRAFARSRHAHATSRLGGRHEPGAAPPAGARSVALGPRYGLR